VQIGYVQLLELIDTAVIVASCIFFEIDKNVKRSVVIIEALLASVITTDFFMLTIINLLLLAKLYSPA